MKRIIGSFLALFFTQCLPAQLTINGELHVQSGGVLMIEGNLTNSSSGVWENRGTITVKGNVVNDATVTAFAGSKLIFGGTSGQTFSGASPLRVNGLEIANDAGLSLSQQLVVEGLLTFTSGSITASDPNAVLLFSGNGASVSNVSGARHINGWAGVVNRSSFEFPSGNGSQLKPILVSSIQNTNTVIKASYNTNNKAVNGTNYSGGLVDISNNWWQIEAPSNTAAVTLYSTSTDDHATAGHINFLRISRLSGGTWTPLSTTVSGSLSNGTLLSTNVAVFGRFAIGVHSTALPIRLVSFGGEWSGNNILLKWKINGDSEVANYEVEESHDALHWTTMATIAPRGSLQTETYTTLDPQLVNGRNYYRLRIRGLDGRTTYSETVSFINKNSFSFYLSPNDDAWGRVTLFNPGLQSYKAILIDPTGKKIQEFRSAQSTYSLDLATVSKGLYYLLVSGENAGTTTLPLIVR